MLDTKIFTFLKVAQHRNYTRAAAELNLTQPAVTQHIKKLEEYYNCTLIDVSCPTENAYLQGRQDLYPKRRGLTRVKEFMEAGINVAFAQDSINDPWYPMGNGNMMNILDNGIHLTQIMSPEEIEKDLDLITYNGARCLNIQDRYGLDVGKDANFIVLDGDSPFDVIRNRAGVLASIRKGEYLFKNLKISNLLLGNQD